MSHWVETFNDPGKTRQSWACTGCGVKDRHHDHEHGPKNGMCRCTSTRAVSGNSEAYRDNWERIFGAERN